MRPTVGQPDDGRAGQGCGLHDLPTGLRDVLRRNGPFVGRNGRHALYTAAADAPAVQRISPVRRTLVQKLLSWGVAIFGC